MHLIYRACELVQKTWIKISFKKIFHLTLTRLFYDPAKAGWEQEYNFEPEVDGLVTVMNKTNGTDLHQVDNMYP